MKFSISHTGTLTVAVGAALLAAGALPASADPLHSVSLERVTPRILSEGSWRAAEKTATRGTTAPDKKRLTFQVRNVRLVVHTGPDNDMLSYRIADLRNPTLVVPRGVVLNILFINTDDDMLHDLRFTTRHAPFPSLPDKSQSVGTPELRHHTKSIFYAEQLQVRAQPGTYTYLCTVKGHAKGGMYGTLIIR